MDQIRGNDAYYLEVAFPGASPPNTDPDLISSPPTDKLVIALFLQSEFLARSSDWLGGPRRRFDYSVLSACN